MYCTGDMQIMHFLDHADPAQHIKTADVGSCTSHDVDCTHRVQHIKTAGTGSTCTTDDDLDHTDPVQHIKRQVDNLVVLGTIRIIHIPWMI